MSHHQSLVPLPNTFALCRLPADAPVPSWVSGDFVSITRTANELSIICPQQVVPEDIRSEQGWRCLRVAGTLDLTLVGVLASLLAPLAEAGISVFTLSTFDTDYLLVRETDLTRALVALRTAGHHLQSS